MLSLSVYQIDPQILATLLIKVSRVSIANFAHLLYGDSPVDLYEKLSTPCIQIGHSSVSGNFFVLNVRASRAGNEACVHLIMATF